jgi:hypothetical protein
MGWRTQLKARVNIDYHVAVEGHLYSVPYRLVHEQVEVRIAGDVVEILHGRGRVAAHRLSRVKGGFTTEPEDAQREREVDDRGQAAWRRASIYAGSRPRQARSQPI